MINFHGEMKESGIMYVGLLSKIAVVVPVLNPEPGLVHLINELASVFGHIVVVDDGSDQKEEFSRLPCSVVVIKHEFNRGKGRAIKTAIEWIRTNDDGIETIVFADGDGQHRPEDIKKVALHAMEANRATLGVRDFSQMGIPFRSRFGNVITSFIVRMMYGVPIYDTQTGLRAIPRRLFDIMLSTPGERYEYEMRLFGVLNARGDSFEQVPIKTIYVADNKTSHFKPIRDSVRIYRSLFDGAFVKFCASSMVGFIVDNFVFTVLLFIFQDLGWLRRYDILVSLIGARFLSATVNFLCNKFMVFESNVRFVSSFARYWTIVLLVAFLSYVGTACVSALIDASGWLITFVKIIIDVMLFVVSYQCQRKWVFHPKISGFKGMCCTDNYIRG